jgi:hypothetical protein
MRKSLTPIALCLLLLVIGRVAADDPQPADDSTLQDVANAAAAKAGPTSPAETNWRASVGYLLKDDVHFVELTDRTLSTLNGLGIDVAPATEPLRSQLKLPEKSGLIVTAVPAESIGAKAGIRVNDVLLGVDGTAVGDAKTLAEVLTAAHGKSTKVHLIREGTAFVIEVTPKTSEIFSLTTQVDDLTYVRMHQSVEPQYRIGVSLAEADETLRAQLRLAAGEALVVTDVVAESPAAKGGVEPHDVLIVLDGLRLSTVEAANAQIQEIKDREVELRLLRGGQEKSIRVTPSKSSATPHTALYDQWHSNLANTQNCQSCHESPHGQWATNPRDTLNLSQFALVRDLLATTNRAETSAATPSAKIAGLQQQLAAIQASLAELAASLPPDAPAAANTSAAESPAEPTQVREVEEPAQPK